MRRVIVIGAGFFGGLVARGLAERGVAPLVATRGGADLRVDVEDARSVRAVLREGDVVVDTAGPWQTRTIVLPEQAIERHFDVVDLSESLAWSERVLALGSRAAAAGVRLLPACSAVAAVAAACVRASGTLEPREVDLFLAPASADTASPGTVRSFVASLGAPIRTLREGRLVGVRGYVEARPFPSSGRRGALVESAAALLPLAWPSITRAELWVDPNVPFARVALSLAARVPPLAALARGVAPRVDVRFLGRRDGTFAVSVAGERGRVTFTLSAARGSYRIATEPAVLAAQSLARDPERPRPGVVLPDAHVLPDLLFERLRDLGISIRRAGHP